MRSFTMLAKMQDLGVISSFSRPRVNNDNPYSESLFKTVKYHPSWPTLGFESLESARAWISQFVTWYNYEHKHSGIKYVTPAQRHNGKDLEVLNKRKSVYKQARKEKPERWSKEVRNWDYVKTVYLNPENRAA